MQLIALPDDVQLALDGGAAGAGGLIGRPA